MSKFRRYDLDWIKVIVILNIIPFHVAWMMTSVQGFSQVSQNTLSSRLLLAYFAEILPFQMPLLFLIAGYSAAVSLPEKLGLKPRRSRRLFLCYNILGEVI